MLARVGEDFLPFSIPFYAALSLTSSVSVDTGPKRIYSRKESAGLSDFFAIRMVVVWISARTRARVTFESPCMVKVNDHDIGRWLPQRFPLKGSEPLHTIRSLSPSSYPMTSAPILQPNTPSRASKMAANQFVNLNHLLNFTLPPRQTRPLNNIPRRSRKSGTSQGVWNKERMCFSLSLPISSNP